MSTPIDSLELELISNSTQASKGLDALSGTLGKLRNATQAMTNANNAHGKSYINLYAKIKVGSGALKMGIRTINKFITASSDYVENVNLFNVSMGEYASEAKKYAEEVGNIMGIDPGEWMRNQGVFMTLAKGFGVAGERANTMSKNLTQLGYDISSFVNISTEEAMRKLQSGIAGELEPLRRIGYDLSQARLELEAYNLGISKKVSEMTQAEKAELRYYAIMTHVTDAQGDMARTLDAPANQLRILKAQVTQATRAIGNLFIPILNKVLPVANAVLQVIRALADTIARLFNIEIATVDFSSASEGANAISDGMESAAEGAKKLKNYTAGFDELNVLSTSDSGATDEDKIGGGFSFELPEYDFIGEATQTRVNEIVDKMKEGLGLTEEITSWYDLLETRLGKILIAVGAIGAGIATWKIGTGIYSIVSKLGTSFATLQGWIGGASTSLSTFATSLGTTAGTVLGVVALILAFVAGLTAVYFTNENVRTSVNNAVKAIGESLVPLFTFITDTIIPDLLSGWNGLLTILAPLGDWLKMAFTSIWEDMLIPALEYIGGTVIPSLTETLSNLWNNVFVPFGSFLSAVFTPVINILTELLTMLWQNVIVPVAEFIGNVFAKAWEGLVAILNNGIIPVVSTIINTMTFLWKEVLTPIVNFVWDVLKVSFEDVFNSIGLILEDLKKVFSGLIDFVVGVFTGDWDLACQGVVDVFVGILNTIEHAVVAPINAVIGIFEGLINKIIDGWNCLKRQINKIDITLPDWLGGEHIGGFDLEMSPHVKLARYEDGGFPAQGQMFIAREAGAEMVGSIGRRTAVANNDQIVAGIASGVASANNESNALLREQNSLLRAMLEKESGVYLDGKEITKSVEKHQRERGRVLVTGGAY